jgi:hypothetical protein
MDEAYNQHASHVRRKNRSSTNLHRLTLAPLTAKFPLADADEASAVANLPDHLLAIASATATTSYLQGRSAPTTPGLISRSPGPYSRSSSRSRSRAENGGTATPGHHPKKSAVKKSKSTTQLVGSLAITSSTESSSGMIATAAPPRRKAKSGYATPNPHHPYHQRRRHGGSDSLENNNNNGNNGYGDSDWLLRAGAVLSTEARESKGQAWLVSRESSTSLAGMGLGMHDADVEAFERELARERAVASRMASRRGSAQLDDELEEKGGTKRSSRRGSRSGGWSQAMTPLDHNSPHQSHHHLHSQHSHHHHSHHHGHDHQQEHSSDYFTHDGSGSGHDSAHADTPGPDFVNLDEKLEGLAQDIANSKNNRNADSQDDEAVVRKLVRRGNSSLWNMFGFTLFSVAENDGEAEYEDDEDEDEDDYVGDDYDGEYDDENLRGGNRARAARALRHLEVPEERIPAPRDDEGGWKDAAWLLSVASRVLL